MITVSVPGKIHLMGEHAVVYGTPALLAAINKRMSISIESAKKTEIITLESKKYVSYALEQVKKYLHMETLPPMRITITSNIPAGFHLGSSAAAAVGIVAAVIYFIKKIWNPNLINQIAYEVEKKQHGNPSGGDNTIVTMGGMIWFRKELEFLKSIWQLDIAIPKSLNHFVLVNTGKPKETTGEMVAFVRIKVNKNPEKMKRLFLENEEQVKKIAVAIKEENETMLLNALKQGEQTLEKMGVVGKTIIPCIRAIEASGGAVKILGGGGKKEGVGFLLCYHKKKKILENITKKFGYPIENIVLGEAGVRLDRKE